MIAAMLTRVAKNIDDYSKPYKGGRIVTPPSVSHRSSLGEVGVQASVGLRALADLATDFFSTDGVSFFPVSDRCFECNPYPDRVSRAIGTVLLRLRMGPASTERLVFDADTPLSTLYVALRAMTRKGFIYRDGCLYWITPAGMDVSGLVPPFVRHSFQQCITDWWFNDAVEEGVAEFCDITADNVADMRAAARIVTPAAVAA